MIYAPDAETDAGWMADGIGRAEFAVAAAWTDAIRGIKQRRYNAQQLADALGVSRATVYRMMKVVTDAENA